MKRILRLSVVVASIAFSNLDVYAADPVDVEENRNGFYVGIIGGYEDAAVDIEGTRDEVDGFPDLSNGEHTSLDADGYLIGGEVGHDWRHGNLVYGVFGDFTYSTLEGERFSRYGYSDSDETMCAEGRCRNNDDDLFTVSNPFVASIGARVGVDMGPLVLFAGAGLSVGKLEVEVVDDNSDSNGGTNTNSVGEGSDDNWSLGYKLKLGAEMPVTEAVTIGLSYEYLSLESETYKVAGPSFGTTDYSDVNYRVELEEYRSNRFLLSFKYGF